MKCDTKYPIFLIHGTGFRDYKHFNYWGRIPSALEEEGASIHYGNQDCWGSVADNASIIKDTLEKFFEETQCEKVNILAHSKGGLEARYLISTLGMESKIASLTTIATPHHGSKSIDFVSKFPIWMFHFIAFFVNSFSRFVGDKKPDFFTTSTQFSTKYMHEFNKNNPDSAEVYYQSYATVMKNPLSDILLWFPNFIINLIEGENDGLVTPESAKWTNFKGVLRGQTRRGISHVDSIDARRKYFHSPKSVTGESNVLEFYINLVSELKKMGF